MLHTAKVYFATLPVFLAIDFFWLGFLMSKFYKTEAWVPIQGCIRILCNSLVGGGSCLYLHTPWHCLLCAPQGRKFSNPALGPGVGRPLRFCHVRGVRHDQLALVNKWPLRMSIVDICWGIFICGTVSTAAVYFDRWFQ